MRDLFALAQEAYGDIEWKLSPTEALDRLMDFFSLRLRNFYQNLGKETTLVDAALGAGVRDVKTCDLRLEALAAFRKEPGYTEAVQTFKRVANIIRKQSDGREGIPAVWRKSLLQEEPEKKLADAGRGAARTG